MMAMLALRVRPLHLVGLATDAFLLGCAMMLPVLLGIKIFERSGKGAAKGARCREMDVGINGSYCFQAEIQQDALDHRAIGYVLFTGFAASILYDNIGNILSKLAMILFIAMAVLFLALLLMTMFMDYPMSIEFGMP